jgi:HK97 family phage major capsid protein
MATDKSFSLSRMLANIETQNSPEFEFHHRLTRANESWKNKFGIGSAGMRRGASEICVPWSALRVNKKKRLTRDLQTTTQSQGAFTVGTDVSPLGVQKSLRPTSIVLKLGVTVIEGLQGSTVLPRISSGVTPSSGTEIQNLTPSSDPAFSASAGGPQRMTVSVTFSRQLLAQAGGNAGIDAVLSEELCRAISTQIDSQILTGTGVAGQALGILTQPGATSTNTYVAANGFPQLISAQKQIEDAFVDSTSACWLISTNTAKVWRTLLKTGSTARFILDRDSKVNDIPAYATSFIPGSSDQTVLADWRQLVLGFWGSSLDMVYDPFTLASTGEIRIVVNIFWQAWIRRPQTFVISTNAGSIFTS